MYMADNTITIKEELRPCAVNLNGNRYRALFHCWEIADNGRVSALVELENGSMNKIHPADLFFADDKVRQVWYESGCFPELRDIKPISLDDGYPRG